MKVLRLFQRFFVFSVSIVSAVAAPMDDIRIGIQNLDAAPNYSWKSVTKSKNSTLSSAQSPIEGRTERGGFTYFQFVMGGNPVAVALTGGRAAIKTESEWVSDSELQGDQAWIARRLQAFKPPAVEAIDLIEKAESLKKGWRGVYSGNLKASGVSELLLDRSRDKSSATVAPGAEGTFKLWVKKGRLAKYEFRIKGKMVLKDYGQQFDIDRTTTVEIDKVGSTRVAVPAQAKQKLLN